MTENARSLAALLAVLGEGELWVKISGADRNAVAAPVYADALPVAQELITPPHLRPVGEADAVPWKCNPG